MLTIPDRCHHEPEAHPRDCVYCALEAAGFDRPASPGPLLAAAAADVDALATANVGALGDMREWIEVYRRGADERGDGAVAGLCTQWIAALDAIGPVIERIVARAPAAPPIIPPDQWAYPPAVACARSICRVCGKGSLRDADHSRCNASLRSHFTPTEATRA